MDGVKIPRGTLTSVVLSVSPILGDHVSSKSASVKVENQQVHLHVTKLAKC